MKKRKKKLKVILCKFFRQYKLVNEDMDDDDDDGY